MYPEDPEEEEFNLACQEEVKAWEEEKWRVRLQPLHSRINELTQQNAIVLKTLEDHRQVINYLLTKLNPTQ